MNQDKLQTLQGIMQEMVDTGFAAGVNCMVLHKGEEQCYFEAGYQDIETEKMIKRDTIFRLYSMSKPVTAVAAMILVDQGKMDLADPVEKFLPGFKNQYAIENGKVIPVAMPMTIQNLFNMTSGLVYPGEGSPAEVRNGVLMDEIVAKLDTEEALSTVEIANRIGQLPLAFAPGKVWHYGLSADVLGAVVEVVSGMSFSAFMKKYIFEPLGMMDTGFYVPEEKQHRLASVYRSLENGTVEKYTYSHLGIQNLMKREPAFASGGAGLVSTIDDYSKFTQMLLNKGTLNGVQILSPKAVEYLTTAHVTEAQRDGVREWESLAGHTYGNLMRILVEPEYALSFGTKGEYGWDGWLGTYMSNDPVNDLTFLMMYQKVDAGTTVYTRKMRNVVFSALD